MTATFLAMAVRPIALFILLGCICLPARYAVKRFLPEGKLKRLLLTEVKKSKPR